MSKILFFDSLKYYWIRPNLRQLANILSIETGGLTRLSRQEPVSIAFPPAVQEALTHSVFVVIVPARLLLISFARVLAFKAELQLEFLLKGYVIYLESRICQITRLKGSVY